MWCGYFNGLKAIFFFFFSFFFSSKILIKAESCLFFSNIFGLDWTFKKKIEDDDEKEEATGLRKKKSLYNNREAVNKGACPFGRDW